MMKREVISACKGFGTQIYTVTQIAEKIGKPRNRVRHVLWKLEAEGAIVRFAEKEMHPEFKKGRPKKEIMYRNTRNLGKVERKTAENGWDKMWKVVRALRKFTRQDLMVICNQTIANVIFFTKYYRRLGYMRPTKNAGKGSFWILCKDPGPKRPVGKGGANGMV